MVKNTPRVSFSVPEKKITQFESENNAERKQLFGKCCKHCFSTALNGFILHRTFFAYHNICVIFFTEFFLCSIFFIVHCYVQQCMAMRNRNAVFSHACGINTSRSPTNILAHASIQVYGKRKRVKKMYLTCASALS